VQQKRKETKMMNEIHSALSRCSVLVRCRFLFGFRQQICDDQYIFDKKKTKDTADSHDFSSQSN